MFQQQINACTSKSITLTLPALLTRMFRPFQYIQIKVIAMYRNPPILVNGSKCSEKTNQKVI